MVKLQNWHGRLFNSFSVPCRKSLGKTFITGLCAGLALTASSMSFAAPKQAEYLDRGVVALPSGNGIFISWRMFGDDPTNIGFNVYRNGSKITASPITNSTNFLDGSGTTSAAYTVRPVVNGVELGANAAKPTWTNPYWVINLNRPGSSYAPGDASVGDLDGDGEYEVVLKWDPSNAQDNANAGTTGNVYIDAYKLNGTRLWRIDLGRNIRAGAHYTQFMVYDLDGDGKAEVAMKTAPGTRDAAGTVLGGANANADYRNGDGYILSGPEYLTVFNGQTGAAMATTDYIPARGSVSSWGDSYGNRVDRFLAGIAYVDGQRPSLIMARGYYTRAVVVAWDWRDGRLTRRWTFDSTSGAAGASAVSGQGAHSLTIGDVDQDGKDEIVYGAAVIDDNGSALYSTRLGHGDALHLGDFLPSRAGLEVFMVHESPSSYGTRGVEMHDAKTGQFIWSFQGGGDIGRGVIMDVDPNRPGAESWASAGGLNAANGASIGSAKPGAANFAAWWDGDLTREILNSNTIDKWVPASNNTRRLLSAGTYNATSNNGTKSVPALSADLFGDWREEVIWRNTNNTQLMIFTTNHVTNHKLPTLMHDIQYREAIAWQNTAYNQPPHPSFFLGAGMTAPPRADLHFVGDNPNDEIPGSSSSSASSLARSSLTSAANSSALTSGITLGGTVGDGEVALHWTVNGNISSLDIFQDTDSNPTGRARIAALDTNARSYTATGLSNGTTYWYWAKYTLNGVIYNSNAFSATPSVSSTAAQSSAPRSVAASSVLSSVGISSVPGSIASSRANSSNNNCPAIAVTPHIKVGSNNWQQTGTATISSGTSVVFGPHPYNQGGNWSWSGCGTSGSSREQTVSPMSSCEALATFTNNCGTQTSYTYQLIVSGTTNSSSSSVSSLPNIGNAINAYDLGVRSNAGDQTARLDAAIQHVYNSGSSKTLYIPEGNYLISGNIRLRAGVNLIGDGIGKTVFRRNDDSGYLISNAHDANLNNAVISRMSLRNNQRLVLLQGVRNLKFTDVEFQGGIVRFESSSDITFDKNVFNENIGKAAYASDVCNRITITNNRFNTLEEGAINLSRHSNSYVANNFITSPSLISSGYAGIRLPNTAFNNTVENNTIINHGRGIFILSSSHDNIVRNNTIDKTSQQGMLIEASNNIIEDNIIIDAGDEAIYVNPSVAASSPTPSPANRNTIARNKISDTRAFDASRFVGLKINGTGNQVINNSVSSRHGRRFKEFGPGNTDQGNTYQ